jgi:CheY-like chemotaxis protein
MTATMLGRHGYTVLTAGTPNEALRLARDHPGQLDLLITDVIMPEMNGRELAQRMTNLHPRLQCVYMSGYTADTIGRHGVLDEGVRYVQKPFTSSALLTTIAAALAEEPAA